MGLTTGSSISGKVIYYVKLVWLSAHSGLEITEEYQILELVLNPKIFPSIEGVSTVDTGRVSTGVLVCK